MEANIHVPLQWPWVKALILNRYTDFSGRIRVQNPLGEFFCWLLLREYKSYYKYMSNRYQRNQCYQAWGRLEILEHKARLCNGTLKILGFSSTDILPNYLGSNGTIQCLRLQSTKSLPSHLSFLLQHHQGQPNGKVFMGRLTPMASLAPGVNSLKRCWKHCHQFISTDRANITAHVETEGMS